MWTTAQTGEEQTWKRRYEVDPFYIKILFDEHEQGAWSGPPTEEEIAWQCLLEVDSSSNGNASETKANESFDNGVFFAIEAKRTPSIVSKLFLKRSEHVR